MDGYYYHGVELYPGCLGEIAETILKILHQGLINRDSIRGYQNKKYNHVCLYKKINIMIMKRRIAF